MLSLKTANCDTCGLMAGWFLLNIETNNSVSRVTGGVETLLTPL